MKKIREKLSWLRVLVGFGFAFLTAGLVTAIREKGFGSSDAAGWVQALGSVAAILGAFAIANQQTHSQIRQAKERELEAALRSAVFANLAAKRVVAAVAHAIRLLEEHAENKDKQFNYDARFLSTAESLILMALERDLAPEHAKLLISLHNDLVNFIQGIADIRGYFDPLGYASVRTKAYDLRGQLQAWSVDANLVEAHAKEVLEAHKLHK